MSKRPREEGNEIQDNSPAPPETENTLQVPKELKIINNTEETKGNEIQDNSPAPPETENTLHVPKESKLNNTESKETSGRGMTRRGGQRQGFRGRTGGRFRGGRDNWGGRVDVGARGNRVFENRGGRVERGGGRRGEGRNERGGGRGGGRSGDRGGGRGRGRGSGPHSSIYIQLPSICEHIYKSGGIIPYSAGKEFGKAYILLGEELRNNELCWCGFGGRRRFYDLNLIECAIREFNEETGFLWDDALQGLRNVLVVDTTPKIWESEGFSVSFVCRINFKENAATEYELIRQELEQKIKASLPDPPTNTQPPTDHPPSDPLSLTNDIKGDTPVLVSDSSPTKDQEPTEPVNGTNPTPVVPTKQMDAVPTEQTSDPPTFLSTVQVPYPPNIPTVEASNPTPTVPAVEATPTPTIPTVEAPNPTPNQPQEDNKEFRISRFIEQRCQKCKNSNRSYNEIGKTRLEWFPVLKVVEAVEKHQGCLNPEAPINEQKWLYTYFFQILKIRSVLDLIKVLPMKASLKSLPGVVDNTNKN